MLDGDLHHLCSESKSVEQLGGNHTTDLCLCFFLLLLRKTVFSLDAAYNQFYFGCAVCSLCLNFAYCAITYVASGDYVIRTNSFKLHASGRFQ